MAATGMTSAKLATRCTVEGDTRAPNPTVLENAASGESPLWVERVEASVSTALAFYEERVSVLRASIARQNRAPTDHALNITEQTGDVVRVVRASGAAIDTDAERLAYRRELLEARAAIDAALADLGDGSVDAVTAAIRRAVAP